MYALLSILNLFNIILLCCGHQYFTGLISLTKSIFVIYKLCPSKAQTSTDATANDL